MCNWGASHFMCRYDCPNGYATKHWKKAFNICQPCDVAKMFADVAAGEQLPHRGVYSKRHPHRMWLCDPTEQNHDPLMDRGPFFPCRVCRGLSDVDTDGEGQAGEEQVGEEQAGEGGAK